MEGGRAMKPSLELIRLEERHRYGTFGMLKINKELLCVTLEPPDRLNHAGKSSIPAQQYSCYPFQSSKFGSTWRVADVPGREGILFHPGNTVCDTSGCILLAEHFGKVYGDRAILNSGKTFKMFLAILQPYGMASLTVKECF